MLASSCAFFDNPTGDIGRVSAGVPPPSSTAPLPPPLPSTLPAPGNSSANTELQPISTATANTRTASTPTGSSASLPSLPGSGSYLTVASLIDVPEDATNLAFVHFTQTGSNGDSARAVAVCQATMKNMPLVPVSNIPSGANTVLVWPVSNTDSGNSCLEIIANYEPLDISNATAKRVNDSSKGPFLLTRNAGQNKRLIYDLSYIGKSGLDKAIDEWRSLLGSDPANWPEYRSAR